MRRKSQPCIMSTASSREKSHLVIKREPGVKPEIIDLDSIPDVEIKEEADIQSVQSASNDAELKRKKEKAKRLAEEIEDAERIAKLKRQQRELEEKIEASEKRGN